MSNTRRLIVVSALAIAGALASIATAAAATFNPAGDSFAIKSTNLTLKMDAGNYAPIECSNTQSNGTLANPASSVAAIGPPTTTGCKWPRSSSVTVVPKGSWSLEANSTSSVTLKGTGLQVSVPGVCVVDLASPVSLTGTWSNISHQLYLSNQWFSYNVTFQSTPYSCMAYGITTGPPGPWWGKLSGVFTLTNTTHPATPVVVSP